jgi:hypothetical protein
MSFYEVIHRGESNNDLYATSHERILSLMQKSNNVCFVTSYGIGILIGNHVIA